MSPIVQTINECMEEIHRKYGEFNRKAFVCSGVDLAIIDGEYAELVGERILWYNLELMQDCFGIGWRGEGYGTDANERGRIRIESGVIRCEE